MRLVCGEGRRVERVVVKRVYAASACGERRRLRGGTCERRMLRNARRSSGSSGHASGSRCRSTASGAVERVGASEASRGEAEPLRKRVTAQRGNERRGTSRFVGCGMGERGGEARPHHGGVRAPGGFMRGAQLLISLLQELSRVYLVVTSCHLKTSKVTGIGPNRKPSALPNTQA